MGVGTGKAKLCGTLADEEISVGEDRERMDGGC